MDRVKGTRDFYPEDMEVENYIFSTWKKVAESFGYKEVEGPILESEEIYRKSGEEIPQQTYSLIDKSGRKLVLRPELTPTLARMIQQRKDLPKPIKWFSIPRCFRYEAPQLGRSREFFQFNIDNLGSESMLADAEIILTSIEIMKKFKLTNKDFYIRISNKKVAESFLISLGIKNIKEVSRLIDKKEKLSQENFFLSLRNCGLEKEQITSLYKFLAVKDLESLKEYCQTDFGKKGIEELASLFGYLNKFNVRKYCKLDLSIMRGFDYYTSTIFEVFDANGTYRAIAGGGRYDNLAGIPGIGYGMGDVILELFLKEKNKLKIKSSEKKVYIVYIGDKSLIQSIKVAEKLREFTSVELDVMNKSLSKQLAYADQIKADYVILIGTDELKKKKLRLKDMKTGKERLLSLEQVCKSLSKKTSSKAI
ncbi:histidine--tRNA ligase [Candidatus Woesearchaeota archaeon]|nr:histidine--tRNA ligase [Candidatus Woesearchaeota archaeon]